MTGMMVNVEAGNAKLKRRAVGIVAAHRRGGRGPRRVQRSTPAGGQVKPAVLLCAGAQDHAAAQQLLADANGNLRLALSRLADA